MVSKWATSTIAEIAERVGMGPFGSSIKVETFVREGVPVINGKHLHNTRVDDEPGFNFIAYDHADRLAKANVQRGDIVLTHRGTIGQASYIPDDSEHARYVISQSQFFLRCDRSKALPEFVILYFRSEEGQHRLLANSSQVGVPSIAQPVTYLRTIEIPLPPLAEQRAIAEIVGTLEDKIELNRRLRETLDEMVHALFKSWFVDFDPVRAKVERRDSRLPVQIAGIFPTRFVESQIGAVPEGWEVSQLTEMIEVNPARRLRKGQVAPYLDMANMPTVGHTPDTVRERTFGTGMRFTNGDTLVARITPCLENGKTAYVDFMDEGTIGWGSTEYIVMRAKPPLPSEFSYCLARSPRFRSFMIKNMSGTSGRQRVPPQSLAHFYLPGPSEQVARAFETTVRPLIERARDADRESKCLGKLRDALLPRLISAELRTEPWNPATA